MKCICFLFLYLVTLEACKKTNSAPIPPSPPEPDIFIGGSLTLPNGFGYGVTWKNGTAAVVPDSSMPISLSYTVNDLYVLGSSGIYSRDGIQPALQCPVGGGNIAALGTDVYISCRNSSDNAALYWKNGQFVYLTMIGGLINHAMSTNILISGMDIYVTGTINEYPDYIDKAVYWKNGVINYLPDGYSASSIVVSGNNVYVTGNSNNRAAYWINGQLHVLGQYDEISGIVVSGTDVYMAGRNFLGDSPGQAFYYKNDQKIILPNGTVAYGIGVNDTDVYCAGRDSANNAVYWKNTEKHILGPQGIAYCILVEKK